MIKIYTVASCSSCRKVKKWFMDNDIPFIEKDLLRKNLSEKELKELLTKSENGTDDIISKRSKIISEGNVDIDNMSVNELIAFIKENPTVLKRPIIVDDNKIQIGYNPEDISVFIPAAKKFAMLACSLNNCEKFPTCEHADDNSR